MNDNLPPSARRVRMATTKELNQKIKQKTIDNIKNYKNADNFALTQRLKQLDKEWDTEKVLEANASFIILISSILGIIFSPYLFILTGVISFYLLFHAITGWCPPLPVIRKLGIRSPEEIYEEKTALKYLRGDFKYSLTHAEDIYDAIRKE